MKKRLLALFVAMTLVFAYAVPAAVYADDEVKSVKVTALPEFAVGASVADAKATVEAPEGVEVETVWTVYKPGFDPENEYTFWFELKDEYLVAHPTFQTDTVYMLSLECKEQVEFEFAESLSQWNGTDVWSDGEVYFVELGRYSDTTEIAKVDITTSAPEVGATASIESVKLYDAADNALPEAATENDIHWVYLTEDYETVPMDGQVLEAEKAYHVWIEMTATTGYTFPEKYTLVVNGVEREAIAEPKSVQDAEIYSFYSPLGHIEVAGLGSFEAGDVIPGELELVDGISEHSLSVDWYVESAEYEGEWDDAEAGTEFEAGKNYKAILWFNGGNQPLADNFYFTINEKGYVPTELNPEYNQAVLEYIVEIPADVAAEDEPVVEDEAEKEKAPATGDANTMIPLAVLIAAGTAAMALRRRAQ